MLYKSDQKHYLIPEITDRFYSVIILLHKQLKVKVDIVSITACK
jgi:hypothetical protein